MKMFELRDTGRQVINCPADDDLTIVIPPVPRTGGLDIIGGGRNVVVKGEAAPGDLGGLRIETAGKFDKLEFFNLRTDARKMEACDVIGLGGKAKTRVLRKCRLLGAPGEFKGRHPDIFQDRPGSETDLLYVTDCTVGAGYQIGMLKLRPAGGIMEGTRRLVIERTNFLNLAEIRRQRSFALITEGRIQVEFREVYLDPTWPWGLAKAHLVNQARVTGRIILGHPPGGDFCPA